MSLNIAAAIVMTLGVRGYRPGSRAELGGCHEADDFGRQDCDAARVFAAVLVQERQAQVA